MFERRRAGAVVLGLLATAGCRPPPESGAPPRELLAEPYVVFAPQGGAPVASPAVLGGEPRPCLPVGTPGEARFRIELPEEPLLSFAVGVRALVERPRSGRVRFVVRAGTEAPSEVVFSRVLHPGRAERWIDHLVDLRAYGGRTVWLSFETSLEEAPEGVEPDVVGLVAEPIVHDRGRYRQGRAVVLVSVDTLRRDHASLYGYRRRTTPSLDALARESVVFDDAVSTSSWTLPAHASLFTSTPASVHGAVSLETRFDDALPRLPALLRAAGLRTQAFVTHLYLSATYGFEHGFDRLVYLPETRAREVTDRAIGFLRAFGDRDFFLFVHYYDPHWHYDPPAPYDRMFYPAYRGAADGVWWRFKEKTKDDLAPEDLRRIVSLYDGEIRYTDRHLGRLVEEMKALGIFDRALLVVTSDHGEEFLEHGGWEHQKTLYEEQLRIPLLVKLPRGRRAGERVFEQVSLLDVAPTVLDALGLPSPASFQGRSLARGSPADAVVAVAETEHTVDGTHKIAFRRGAADKKLIVSIDRATGAVRVELYDLAADPAERTNLAARDPATVEAGRRRLARFLADVEALRRGLPPTPPVTLTPEQVDKLRTLGYAR